MINIFFVPGMFGSSIEFLLRSYTNEYVPVISPEGALCADGSMHSYAKEFHPTRKKQIDEFPKELSEESITTPIYPFQNVHLPEILEKYQSTMQSYNILMHADSLRSAELNMLFQYHKIAFGSNTKMGLEIFCGGNSHNITQWNNNYRHWSEMQSWELREWFSLFYPNWVQEWISSQHQVPLDFLKIVNTDMLFDTENTIIKIIDFCQLTLNKNNLSLFVEEWRSKQEYIIKEFDLIDSIVSSTLTGAEFAWDSLNVIAESIIQQRLRASGFEICCDGLNIFPVDSKSLYNLLEKC